MPEAAELLLSPAKFEQGVGARRLGEVSQPGPALAFLAPEIIEAITARASRLS